MPIAADERPRLAVTPPLPSCEQCGAPIVRRRRSARQNDALCLACDQRARRAAYFKSYYEEHKDRILDKNRRWARDNKVKLIALRQARQARQNRLAAAPKRCLECGVVVIRAARCRKCYIRFRYANDPDYRQRRLATTRRWLSRRASARRRITTVAPPAIGAG